MWRGRLHLHFSPCLTNARFSFSSCCFKSLSLSWHLSMVACTSEGVTHRSSSDRKGMQSCNAARHRARNGIRRDGLSWNGRKAASYTWSCFWNGPWTELSRESDWTEFWSRRMKTHWNIELNNVKLVARLPRSWERKRRSKKFIFSASFRTTHGGYEVNFDRAWLKFNSTANYPVKFWTLNVTDSGAKSLQSLAQEAANRWTRSS